ncbi:hypothetical protein RSOLAG1IB_04792 [Rhizoctonia solani AG-1 IB]|uniref:ZZ-type domain-containing protein n=1 Tax=Thanatephorus cucumeris (strain AG1-IB / isolate 7/3/14) TaxID=1108050 RepID=A0A0B7FWV4_THACB|nr:hypothetical protein RSOLAG1IB_04792 [Rhizoctonia solani AG-1 IB]
MTGIKDALGLNSTPIKLCKDMTNEELLQEELSQRMELTRLVLSLSVHIGTCTTHGVLSAGTTLPLHLPVVVFIAYKLTKVALRHRAIKTEIKANRRGVQLRKISSGGEKRLTAGIILVILAPILSAIGADIVNEIICTLAGTDPIKIASIGSSSSTLALGECSEDGSGADIVLYEGDIDDDKAEKNDISVSSEATQNIIEQLVELWSRKLIRSVSDEFTQLVEEIDLTISRANKSLPSHYQVHCNACFAQISKGYSCQECHDFDLCYECYVGMKHQDVKRHPYIEFMVQEEISQIQRIMVSLRRETVIVEHGRGSHTQCNVCLSMISEPTRIGKGTGMSTYYRCKGCPDFDICTKCFPEEAAKAIHSDHKFNMIVATDDEATISRLSPTIHARGLSSSSNSSSNSWVRTPVSTPESLGLPTPPPYGSLFSSTPWVTSPTSPISSPPLYPSTRSENIWHRDQHFGCDACYNIIDDDRRLYCVDCQFDLHVKCQNWSGRGHQRFHRIRVLVKDV